MLHRFASENLRPFIRRVAFVNDFFPMAYVVDIAALAGVLASAFGVNDRQT